MNPNLRAAPISADDDPRLLALARDVLTTEAASVAALAGRLGQPFLQAVRMILACQGRVVVSGIGKSGHIGRKIAATLASTGTPAFFVHPAEASHGDLGMITGEDVVIALSYSGESQELLTIIPLLKRRGARLLAMTGKPASSLADAADVHLDISVEREACPLNLAPTSSTTATLALGDALAVALLDARGFSSEDFARTHPGGALGRRLLVHVRDVMRSGTDLPLVSLNARLSDALIEMSQKGMGMTAVVDADHQVAGIYTDGDLRRSIDKGVDFRTAHIRDVMTTAPHSIHPERLAAEAVAIIQQHRINGLLVVDDGNRLIGAVSMHDLLRAGVV